MDLECPTCSEPWEVEHLRHDEPHEWGLSELELAEVLRTGNFAGPDDRVRQAAQACGWQFAGNSVLSFVRCPSCNGKAEGGLLATSASQRREAVALVAELLDGDEDAMVAMLQDLPAMLATVA